MWRNVCIRPEVGMNSLVDTCCSGYPMCSALFWANEYPVFNWPNFWASLSAHLLLMMSVLHSRDRMKNRLSQSGFHSFAHNDEFRDGGDMTSVRWKKAGRQNLLLIYLRHRLSYLWDYYDNGVWSCKGRGRWIRAWEWCQPGRKLWLKKNWSLGYHTLEVFIYTN